MNVREKIVMVLDNKNAV